MNTGREGGLYYRNRPIVTKTDVSDSGPIEKYFLLGILTAGLLRLYLCCTLSMPNLLQKYQIVLCLLSLQLFACKQEGEKEAKGYIVYILPDNIRFVETKKLPDENYKENFRTSNFSLAFSFKPDSTLEQRITRISSDTLFDENPEMKEHTRFLKEIIVFPAKIRFKETGKMGTFKIRKKFKMMYKGKLVEFDYNEFLGEVVEVSRLGSAS